MSDLIPSIAWVDFKTIVDAGKVSELKSCEILLPEHKFNVIIFHGDSYTVDYARTQSEYLAVKTNAVSCKDPQEILAEIEEEQCLSTSLIAETVVGLRQQRSTKKSKKSNARLVTV